LEKTVDSDGITDPAGEPPRLLITAKEAADSCGKSVRTWREWDSLGFVPAPVRIGRSTLWSILELKRWIAANCPRRAQWEMLRSEAVNEVRN
jgi:predicted DNA-binding transcriptional regulator AlpA